MRHPDIAIRPRVFDGGRRRRQRAAHAEKADSSRRPPASDVASAVAAARKWIVRGADPRVGDDEDESPRTSLGSNTAGAGRPRPPAPGRQHPQCATCPSGGRRSGRGGRLRTTSRLFLYNPGSPTASKQLQALTHHRWQCRVVNVSRSRICQHLGRVWHGSDAAIARRDCIVKPVLAGRQGGVHRFHGSHFELVPVRIAMPTASKLRGDAAARRRRCGRRGHPESLHLIPCRARDRHRGPYGGTGVKCSMLKADREPRPGQPSSMRSRRTEASPATSSRDGRAVTPPSRGTPSSCVRRGPGHRVRRAKHHSTVRQGQR